MPVLAPQDAEISYLLGATRWLHAELWTSTPLPKETFQDQKLHWRVDSDDGGQGSTDLSIDNFDNSHNANIEQKH